MVAWVRVRVRGLGLRLGGYGLGVRVRVRVRGLGLDARVVAVEAVLVVAHVQPRPQHRLLPAGYHPLQPCAGGRHVGRYAGGRFVSRARVASEARAIDEA